MPNGTEIEVVVRDGPYGRSYWPNNEGDKYYVKGRRYTGTASGRIAFVSLHAEGPRGGIREGPTFYTRERINEYIAALEQARDFAFPQPAQNSDDSNSDHVSEAA